MSSPLKDLPAQPPPPYSSHGYPQYPNQQSIILSPTVPPGGIELPHGNDYLVNYLNSKEGQNARVVIIQPPSHPGAALDLMRNSCQTPNGGRFMVNNSGVIEHVSEQEYRRRRTMICAFSTLVIVAIIVYCIIRVITSRRGYYYG